jgi:hypothetical protein
MHDDFRRAGESNTFKAHLEEYLQTSGLIESFHDNPKFDTEGGEGIDTEEEMKAVLEAIYNKDDDNYKYDVSKNIVADYLTRKSESKFYGEFKLDGKELTVKERRAIEPHDKETPESFKKRGGILGIWMNSPNAGVVWNEEYKYFSRTGDLDKLIEEEN